MFSEQIKNEYLERKYLAEHECYQRVATVFSTHPDLQLLNDEIQKLRLSLIYAQINNQSQEMIKAELSSVENKFKAVLQANGIAENFAKIRYTCSKCEDTGLLKHGFCDCYKELAAKFVKIPEQERCIERAYFQNFNWQYFTPSGNQVNPTVGDGNADNNNVYLSKKQMEKKQMENAYLWARNLVLSWQEPQYLNGLLSGLTGTGKTYLAGCILHELRDKGKVGLFLSSEYFFNFMAELKILRQNFNPDSSRLEELAELETWVFKADFLVIDDLGTEAANLNQRLPLLLRLLNERTLPDYRTLFTSNFSLEELAKCYDERIVSRLRKDYAYLYLSGDDLRLKHR